MTASDIVDRFGGTSALAKLLDAKVSTVHSWRATNSIPEWRQEKILQVALTEGIELATTDFPAPDARIAA
jgi:hypothetical protein